MHPPPAHAYPPDLAARAEDRWSSLPPGPALPPRVLLEHILSTAFQASLLRDELLRVIDAKVALEHEMETLRHRLTRSTERTDDLDSQLTGVRTMPGSATELSGKPALREAVEADLGEAAPGG